jgi:quercetin dioxygenase-like cupin family protein
MKASLRRLAPFMAGAALAGVWAARVALGAGGHETVLFSHVLNEATRQTLTAVLVSYAPGGKSPRHHHAGSVFAYIVAGQIRSQNSATGPVRVYRTGETFFEPEGSVHLVSENASATEEAQLLAVFVAPADVPLTMLDH